MHGAYFIEDIQTLNKPKSRSLNFLNNIYFIIIR